MSSQLNLLRNEFSPELTRPISCPGPSHTAWSCQGWFRESSCCYQRPGMQMPFDSNTFIKFLKLAHFAPEVGWQFVQFRSEAERWHFSTAKLHALLRLKALHADNFQINIVNSDFGNWGTISYPLQKSIFTGTSKSTIFFVFPFLKQSCFLQHKIDLCNHSKVRQYRSCIWNSSANWCGEKRHLRRM